MEILDAMNAFEVLADPTRRAMLARLANGEATVNELAEPFDMSLPAVSRHLKVLERAGLITRGRDAQYRPCRLEPEPLQEVAAWLDPEPRGYWDTGDSIVSEYAPFCDGVYEVRNLRQLQKFVEDVVGV